MTLNSRKRVLRNTCCNTIDAIIVVAKLRAVSDQHQKLRILLEIRLESQKHSSSTYLTIKYKLFNSSQGISHISQPAEVECSTVIPSTTVVVINTILYTIINKHASYGMRL